MLEIPCTLRCDGCGVAHNVVATAKSVGIGPDYDIDRVNAFVVTDSVMPAGWRVVFDELRCPSCNGAK